MTKEPQLNDYALNEEAPLSATRILYVDQKSSISTTTTIIDLTGQDDLVIDSSGEMSKAIFDKAKTAANGAKPILELRRESWYKRVFTTKDAEDQLVAEVSGPLLAMGHWKLSFPQDSTHSSHAIELRPAGMGKRADVFVQDSILYFWDVVDPGSLFKLYKVMDGKRIEAAAFVSKSSHGPKGLLMIDDKLVDVVVACVTFVAVLNRNESFRK
jgi:hypothetical protein